MPTEHPAEATLCQECGRRLMLFADRCPECVPRIPRRQGSGAWLTALVVLAPLGVGLALSSEDAIRLLNYPPTFMNSAPILSLLALLLPISGALMIMSSLAMAIGQEKQWVKISAFGVCVFPPLYFGLIWVFQNGMGNGGIGAALASVIGER